MAELIVFFPFFHSSYQNRCKQTAKHYGHLYGFAGYRKLGQERRFVPGFYRKLRQIGLSRAHVLLGECGCLRALKNFSSSDALKNRLSRL